MSLTETPLLQLSVLLDAKETWPVVSVIQLMATISYFTWAQPPSVCKVQVRFIVSRLKTNGNSPRATHTDHWAVRLSTLSELPAEASEQENWGEDCAQVTVSQPVWCITRTSLWANKSCSDQINIWCSGSSSNVCCFDCGAGLIWVIQHTVVRWVEWHFFCFTLLHIVIAASFLTTRWKQSIRDCDLLGSVKTLQAEYRWTQWTTTETFTAACVRC